ncbi:hypothetical protein PoMZ_07388 [Pyricularia oryzae]|uniref:MAGE domain-containing protein n=1 Tax=Pyricularia oryzae TaxID=318829 RepID=A0A4P7NF02_PYROR|nr:hypothetical protein PoMZ_07388 [Pyricularia oryzae]
MPTLPRRRRPADEEVDDQDDRPTQRRRRAGDEDSEGASEEAGGAEGDGSIETQLIKKLVRIAMKRRADTDVLVLGAHGRSFRHVFDGAQKQLRAVFGMEMVELPVRDKTTLSVEEQRKAAKSQSKGSSSSNTYILVTTLPEDYRTAAIVAPSRIPTAEKEAAYVGLYSMIVTIIQLNRGELSDPKLKRYLQRLNAETNTPVEKTDLLLQRLIRQNYIVKTVERNAQGDDDAITWRVGPRAKQELTDEAMASIVRDVYGEAYDQELEAKLQASLKIRERKPVNGIIEADQGEAVDADADADENEDDAEEED